MWAFFWLLKYTRQFSIRAKQKLILWSYCHWHFFVTGIFCKSIDKDQIKWSHLGPKLVFWIPLAAATVYVLFSSLCHNRNWTSDTLWNFHTCLIFIIFNSCFHIGDMRWESVCISPMDLWSCSDFIWRVLVVFLLSGKDREPYRTTQ